MYISETNLIVRYAETDQMGIVHHSNYPIWFEVGRTDFIRKLGMPYSKIENKGLLMPLISLKCNFKSHAKYEDRIIVRTRINQFTGIRLSFYYEVIKEEDSKILTTGETEHVWTTKELKPINLRKHDPDLYELLLEAMK